MLLPVPVNPVPNVPAFMLNSPATRAIGRGPSITIFTASFLNCGVNLMRFVAIDLLSDAAKGSGTRCPGSWGHPRESEAARHARVIDSLETHLRRLKNSG